jgi:hypothetical protein
MFNFFDRLFPVSDFVEPLDIAPPAPPPPAPVTTRDRLERELVKTRADMAQQWQVVQRLNREYHTAIANVEALSVLARELQRQLKNDHNIS